MKKFVVQTHREIFTTTCFDKPHSNFPPEVNPGAYASFIEGRIINFDLGPLKEKRQEFLVHHIIAFVKDFQHSLSWLSELGLVRNKVTCPSLIVCVFGMFALISLL